MNTYKVEGDDLVESDVPAVVLSRQYIVRRESNADRGLPACEAWTGPMAHLAHAERERDAWLQAGRRAEVVEYTADVAERVRKWSKSIERRPFDAVSS